MKLYYRIIIPFFIITVLLSGSALFAKDTALEYKLKPGAAGKLCINCHTAFQEKMQKPYVHTPLKKGECTGCHNPHATDHGKLLSAGTESICASCHKSIIPSNAKSTHKVVADGQCVKCHDPHSSANKNGLLKSGNELCFTCHTKLGETVSKAKFKHNPVEKGCQTCHLPHASSKGPALLVQDINALCTGCHKTDRPNFSKQHMNYPVANTRCTACHDPHGSDKPRLLYNTIHAPVANKMCNQCHEEGSLKTKKSGAETCRGCHNDMFNRTFDKNRIHGPLMSKESCLNCHDPHAGKQKGLLKLPMLQLCASCHSDTINRLNKSVSQHEPVKNGDCTMCHDPHSSNTIFMAQKENEIDLCGTCHDWSTHSSHPIGDKFKDPRNKNLTMSCRSCHRTHGTEFKKMLIAPTVTELCVQCHEQFKR